MLGLVIFEPPKPKSPLILPGDPGFLETLVSPPPIVAHSESTTASGIGFVVEPGSGLLRPANYDEIQEYCYGGEYDARLAEIGEDAEPNDLK